MPDCGFVLIHRSVWSSDDFDPEPFTQREAFLWLVSNAAWKPCKVRYGPHTYHLERGDYVSSIRRLGEQWGWHRCKVDRFLNNLVDRGVIKIGIQPRQSRDKTRDKSETEPETTSETHRKRYASLITICNYNKYQGERGTNDTLDETCGETPDKVQPRQSRDKSETYKNKNNKLTRKQEDLDSKESIDHFFETEFWPAYPKKVGKGDALKAIKAAAKRSSTGEIIVGLRRACDHWRAVGTDPQFIPNPGTWLRADRWKDEQPACGPPRRFEVVNGGGGTVFDKLRRKYEDEENDGRLF
jgi:hypothetical protein